MDINNGRHSASNGGPINGRLNASNGVDATDWRSQLRPEARQRIVNKIIEIMRRHIPSFGDDQIRNIAVRIEDKIYSVACSQSDYLTRLALKMFSFQSSSQNTLPNPGSASTAQGQGDSAS